MNASIHYVIGNVAELDRMRAKNTGSTFRLLPDVAHTYGLAIFPWDTVHYAVTFQQWDDDDKRLMRQAISTAQERGHAVELERGQFAAGAQEIIDNSRTITTMLANDHREDCMVLVYPHPTSVCTCADEYANWTVTNAD